MKPFKLYVAWQDTEFGLKTQAFVGTLAQLVEQRTFNPFVVGSTPARPTKIQRPEIVFRPFLFFEVGS